MRRSNYAKKRHYDSHLTSEDGWLAVLFAFVQTLESDQQTIRYSLYAEWAIARPGITIELNLLISHGFDENVLALIISNSR